MSKYIKYYIQKPFILCGYANAPFCIRNTKNGELYKLSLRDFVLLKDCCNGFELRENNPDYSESITRLTYWQKKGVIGTKPRYKTRAEYRYFEYVGRIEIQIAITANCNYSCRHCLASQGEENSREALSAEFCKQILKQANDCGIKQVLLTGGEPLIHPGFIEIVENISKEDMILTQVLTNGALLTKELLMTLKALGQKPSFAISFDGLGTHDWMRNHIGAEKLALQAMCMTKEMGFGVSANINVNRVTLPRLTETCRYLVRKCSITYLHLMLTSPVPRWELTGKGRYDLSFEEYFDAMLSLIETSKEENWSAILDIFLVPGLHNKKNISFEKMEKPQKATGREKLMKFCPKTDRIVFVGHNGRVLPCSAYEGVTNAIGFMQGKDLNLHHHRLSEILTSSSYLEPFKLTVSDLYKEEEQCRNCKWTSLCCGGCRAFSFYDFQKWHSQSRAGKATCVFFHGGYAEKYLEILKKYMACS